MPTVVLRPGVTVFVTGVNGLIGSHIVDQLLLRGYHVRGAVRNVEKNTWLVDWFTKKYNNVRLDLVDVPDMTEEGCYDDVVDGVDGFIHVASPLGGFSDASTAVAIGVKGGLNALQACAKTSSVKRFVFTSSSLAAAFPKPNVECSIDTQTYNEEAVEIVRKDPTIRGLSIYAALKTETEKAMWKWMEKNNPNFVMNTILPNVNFGRVLVPEHQGFPSTIDWARAAWTGESLQAYANFVLPQWFISTEDSALLHIGALIYGDVTSERLFGYAKRFNYNQILAFFREFYPNKKFPKDLIGVGEDKMDVPNERAEEVLTWVKGSGWDGLAKSLKEMSGDWA
ncbi:hypothetical protein ACN47E_005300 [Coniothyrium glycines]